jgi:hypothetical protein
MPLASPKRNKKTEQPIKAARLQWSWQPSYLFETHGFLQKHLFFNSPQILFNTPLRGTHTDGHRLFSVAA